MKSFVLQFFTIYIYMSEEKIINIDSKYRDYSVYPDESKYTINLNNKYKNIISIRIVSLEITNTINYISSQKNNNWFLIHLPNKLNDPDGIKLQLEDGLLQIIGSIKNIVNSLFNILTNTTGALQQISIDNKPFAEKYFYIFYLNNDVEFTFDFNSKNFPNILSEKLKINYGWHSIYGLCDQLKKYITSRFDARKKYKTDNTETEKIDLDDGKFTINNFILRIWDRRFRNLEVPSNDCIRIDNIDVSNTIYNYNNIVELKNKIYLHYLTDTNTYIPSTTGTKILDKLIGNNYIIPETYFGANGNKKYESGSIYYINNNSSQPLSDSTQIYNLMMQIDNISYTVSFENNFTPSIIDEIDFFYYFVDPINNQNSWKNIDQSSQKINNRLINLISKEHLIKYKFLPNPNYTISLIKDIPSFEIDFSTYNLVNPIDNSIIDISKMKYPTLGFYLGFRQDVKKTKDHFLLKSVLDKTKVIIKGLKIYDTTGYDYIFLKINDWGYVDYFGQNLFAKIILTSGLGNSRLDDSVYKEYKFHQPINIQKLNIELVDYLGKTVDLNGFDWSFTLELKENK